MDLLPANFDVAKVEPVKEIVHRTSFAVPLPLETVFVGTGVLNERPRPTPWSCPCASGAPWHGLPVGPRGVPLTFGLMASGRRTATGPVAEMFWPDV